MHAGHSEAGKCEYGTNNPTRDSNTEFDDNFRCGATGCDAATLQINGGTFIETFVRLFQADFQRVLVDNQNDHGNQQIHETRDDARGAFANRFLAFEILHRQRDQQFTEIERESAQMVYF